MLYEPAGLDSECLNAVLVMHSDEDYLDAPTGPELAKRGFRVLCANPMVKEGLFFTQVDKMQAVKGAIEYLRSLPRVNRIILMGHSGGATLMTAYQAIAENGAQIFQGPEKLLPYPDSSVLPPASKSAAGCGDRGTSRTGREPKGSLSVFFSNSRSRYSF